MSIVRSVLTDPTTAQPIRRRQVRVDLVSGPAGAFLADGVHVIATATALTDDSGAWSVDVQPNAAYNPAGTFYRAHVGLSEPLAFVVPAGTAPTGGYTLDELLVDDPAAPGAVVAGVTSAQLSAAQSAAASDATSKANSAQSAAISAAASDATSKANAAQAAAISAAAADATSKANAAQSAAISAAAADATSKANSAQSAAISAAATDATSKANSAQSAAQAFTTAQLGGYAPVTRQVNGHDLSADVTLTAGDVGAASTGALTTEATTARAAETAAQATANAAVGLAIVLGA